jgi:hypothetical protein
MKNIVVIIIFLTFSTCIFAQSDNISNIKLQELYFSKLDFFMEKKFNILHDSITTNKDFKNIVLLKQNKYNVISEINDSLEKKRLLIEEVRDLESFKENYSDKNFREAYLESNLRDVEIYSQRMDSLNSISGLETCAKCAIARKVKFIVVKIENNKIDTINCVKLNYIKIGFKNRKLSKKEDLESSPCTQTKVLSLNGYDGAYLIETYFDGKKYRKTFRINMGMSESDIFILSFPLDKTYLVYD